MNVTVLIYTHKHGQDVTVYATPELAHQAAEQLANEYRADFDID